MFRKLLFPIIIVLTAAICFVFNARHTQHSSILYGDALGYYMYLPSTFIYGNLKKMEALPADRDIPESVMRYAGELGEQSIRTKKGYIVDQYTYGVALMELPFFCVAHAWEKSEGLPANGFSSTYNTAVRVGTALYIVLGLTITLSILRRYFGDTISLLTTVIILLGTNLFWFTVVQPGMSHSFLFFLYALLIWITIRLHEQPSMLRFGLTGLLLGLIIVTRPTDVVSLFIPLLYGIKNKASLRSKLELLRMNRPGIAIAILAGVIPFLPQLVYWKVLSGDWVVYSYGSQGFNWSHPRIIEGLFYFSNGWIPYALPMIFSFVGLMLYRRYADWIAPIIIVLPIYVYLIYSWYCYNYINGLGSRPMLHMYPLLSIPLAAFLQYIARKKWYVKTFFCMVFLFFIAVNYSLSALKTKSMFNSEETNMQYYLSILFKDQISYNDLVCSDVAEWQPDVKELTKLAADTCQQFDDSTSVHYIKDTITGSGHFYYMAEGEEYTPAHASLKYNAALFKDARWIRCSGRFMFDTWPAYRRHILVCCVKRGDDFLMWKGVIIDNKIGLADNSCTHQPFIDHFEHKKWGPVYFFVQVPKGMKEGDELIADVWSVTKKEITIDDLCLELYK